MLNQIHAVYDRVHDHARRVHMQSRGYILNSFFIYFF